MRRIVIPEGALFEGELLLPEEAAIHVRDVLRLARGAELLLGDGAGREAIAELVEVSKRVVRARVASGAIRETEAPRALALALIQCVGKGEKMDAVVRQATELGASAIAPALSARSVARLEARVDRWRAIAEDAVRVSQRAFRPRIDPVAPLAEILARPRKPIALCFAGAAERSLGDHLDATPCPGDGEAELLIGPEGGLDEDELAEAEARGFTLVHLGKHNLRTETAGPAAVAILMYWARAIAR